MSNDKNKTQLISLHLDQWTTDKTYVTRLVDTNLSQVIDEEVFCFTCEDDKTVSKYPGGSRYMHNVYTTLPKYQNITAWCKHDHCNQ